MDTPDEAERPISPEEQAVMKAFNEALMKVGDVSFQEMFSCLESVERRLEKELAHDPSLVLEVRRRVAEEKVVMAKAYEQPLTHAHTLLEQAEALGWTSLEVKAEVLGVFCKHCLDQGDRDLGRRYMEPLVQELEGEVTRTGELWAENHLEACKRLLVELVD